MGDSTRRRRGAWAVVCRQIQRGGMSWRALSTWQAWAFSRNDALYSTTRMFSEVSEYVSALRGLLDLARRRYTA